MGRLSNDYHSTVIERPAHGRKGTGTRPASAHGRKSRQELLTGASPLLPPSGRCVGQPSFWIVLWLVPFGLSALAHAQDAKAQIADHAQEFLRTYCYDCHGGPNDQGTRLTNVLDPQGPAGQARKSQEKAVRRAGRSQRFAPLDHGRQGPLSHATRRRREEAERRRAQGPGAVDPGRRTVPQGDRADTRIHRRRGRAHRPSATTSATRSRPPTGRSSATSRSSTCTTTRRSTDDRSASTARPSRSWSTA